jgi:hypothetical protein
MQNSLYHLIFLSIKSLQGLFKPLLRIKKIPYICSKAPNP